MPIFTSEIRVLFEEPYWICLYECRDGERLRVCKIPFGAEPKEPEVYQFLLAHHHSLRFSPPVAAGRTQPQARNPKRRQRQAAKQMAACGTGTRAQQALAAGREAGKLEKQQKSRVQKQWEIEEKRQKKLAKRKQKHRGR